MIRRFPWSQFVSPLIVRTRNRYLEIPFEETPLIRMRIAKLHIVLLLALTLVYIVESGLPCVDVRACDAACQTVSQGDAGTQDHAPDDHEHPCHHCACPCHQLALDPRGELPVEVSASDIRYLPYSCAPPTTATYPPDHIPLS